MQVRHIRFCIIARYEENEKRKKKKKRKADLERKHFIRNRLVFYLTWEEKKKSFIWVFSLYNEPNNDLGIWQAGSPQRRL